MDIKGTFRGNYSYETLIPGGARSEELDQIDEELKVVPKIRSGLWGI